MSSIEMRIVAWIQAERSDDADIRFLLEALAFEQERIVFLIARTEHPEWTPEDMKAWHDEHPHAQMSQEYWARCVKEAG